ncbi:MAG: hypothetical protein ACXWQQ_05340 [Pseudobdellovibrio sp.]
MTTYFTTIMMMVSAVFLFSTKTERSRVVTIQRPIVITQERKTPAYFAYQQSLALTAKKIQPAIQRSTFLSNLNVQAIGAKIQLAEMKFTKTEYAQIENQFYKARTIASNLNEDMSNLAYEKVIFNQAAETPLRESEEDVPALSPSQKWATVQGKFELTGGVGIVDHVIELKRVEEGQVKEYGRINLQAGTYSIDIASPNGYIIARVKDKSGLIVGEDRQRLVNLQNKGSYFEGPFIRVGHPDTLAANPGAPNPPTIALQKPSSASGGAANVIASAKAVLPTSASAAAIASNVSVSIFDNQKTLSGPEDEFGNISAFSSTISRVYDPSQVYANVTTIRMTGEKSPTPVFTKKWLDGAVSYISDIQQVQFKSSNAPVLMGQVLVDGKPAAGAQVQIESLPSLRAVYLDQFMIPSSGLSATSSNGYFMFVGVDDQTYDVAAVLNNKVVGSQLFIAESGAIAFQNIATKSIPDSLTVRSFDAFTNAVVETDLVVSSQEETIQTIDGTAAVYSHVDNNVSEYLVRTSDPIYVSMRYTQSGRKDYVHLPMIQEAWLNEIKKLKALNDQVNTGTIIGFTPNFSYDAYLASDNYSKSNVVYFTNDGQLSTAPVAGGGFILFNVPMGAREVVLQESETGRIFSQVFDVKYQEVSVTHFDE